MRRRACWLVGVLAASAAIAVPAASALDGAHAASSHTVVLKNLSFDPGTTTIRRGESVTWSWRDGSTPHNVRSKSFRGSSTRTHGSFTVRFTRAGTYSYRCTIHPFMKGKIVVH